MPIVLWLLAAVAGSAKAVSVCGVNSAAILVSERRRSPIASVAYAAALLVGSVVLVGTLAVVGRVAWVAFPIPLQTRASVGAVALVIAGVAEELHGPWLLPHIAWAVPRSWAEARYIGPALFGLIRGIAIFNHSPFASMHLLLLLLLLLADAVPIAAVGLVFALGLWLWSLVYLVAESRGQEWANGLFQALTARVLTANDAVAKFDGLALSAAGCLMATVVILGM